MINVGKVLLWALEIVNKEYKFFIWDFFNINFYEIVVS